MQRSIIILFLTVLCLKSLAQNSKLFPGIREVVKGFYSTYDIRFLEYPFVHFEKRKEGWYIVTQQIVNNTLQPQEKVLFYSNLKHEFEDILINSLSKNEIKTEILPEDYVDEYDLRNFDLQIYYGYDGWYKDVIRELENKNVLTDDELYGLGRAYSESASSLVSDNSGFAVKSEVWILPLSINCLNAEQIQQFHSAGNKALSCFKQLAVRNPDYETVVGKIGMKYSNEVMFQYQIFSAYADKYASTLKLPKDLYSADQLETSKKNLENCPPGAILLSFGDNDYYPVHYLQAALGIRRDVYLINYSLMGLDRYIYRATFPQYESEAIQLSADTSLYIGRRNELIHLKESDSSVTISEMTILLAKNLSVDINDVILNTGKILLSNNTTGGEVVRTSDTKYLFKQQWILLNIIENLHGRKICFPLVFTDELKGLNDYLNLKDDLYIYSN